MSERAGIYLPGDEADHIPDRRLLGVIPIAQAAAADRMHIFLVAIERFDRYADLTVQLVLATGHPSLMRDPAEALWPRPTMSAVDDLGTVFAIGAHRGMGGGRDYRLECEITPAIPDRSRTLAVTIDHVTWENLEGGLPEDVTQGPWTFEVDLTAQVDAKLVSMRE